MDGGYFNIKNIDWLETKEMQFSAQAACTGKEGLIGSRCPQSRLLLRPSRLSVRGLLADGLWLQETFLPC